MLSTDFNVSTLHRMSINKARMAPSIIGSHSRFSNACYGCPKDEFTSSLRISFKGVQLEWSIWEGGIEETPDYLITFLLDESCKSFATHNNTEVMNCIPLRLTG